MAVGVFFFSGLHHYECVTPLVANSLQSGRLWARSTASVHDSPWESRSFCTVFIQVIHGRPGGLFQYTEGEEVKICFASTLLSIRAICPNRVRRRAWIISVSRDWLVWRRTSSLEMKWYHLMPRSIRRHHLWRALIHPACIFLGNRPALWSIQENQQYTGVVEPQLSGQRDSRPPELLVKALHCCTHECTPSHDVWKAVSWRVDVGVLVT